MTRLRMFHRPIFLSMLTVFCAASCVASLAQTFTTLASFDGDNGSVPYYGPLVQGSDGNFYGTTTGGGSNGDNGVIFKITPAGSLTTVYSFCAQANCTDGRIPYSGLVLASDGKFYGTVSRGGQGNAGTVFKITAAGEMTTLYRFCTNFYTGFCLDGEFPEALLVQGSDGNLYGSTSEGGSDVGNFGAVFEIAPSGTFTKLHAFCAQSSCPDGNIPSDLVQGANGNFFGTTSAGGFDQAGTIFEITPERVLTTLYTFCPQTYCSDGARPLAGLVHATDGNFYGTAVTGGSTECTQGCGTIFKITAQGSFSLLHLFCSVSKCADGANPFAGLIQATDGNLYGTTSSGGIYGAGTIFKISPAGKLTTLHSFCAQTNCADGNSPIAGLVQATSGTLYGTTPGGGSTGTKCNAGCGTVFSLSVGLGPFVKTVPLSGSVETSVILLGNNLTGVTSVSFNGAAAAFNVVSSSEIKATVPAGATTGPVEVVMPGGTLKSNVAFRVE